MQNVKEKEVCLVSECILVPTPPFATTNYVQFAWKYGKFPKNLRVAYNNAVDEWLDKYSCYFSSRPEFKGKPPHYYYDPSVTPIRYNRNEAYFVSTGGCTEGDTVTCGGTGSTTAIASFLRAFLCTTVGNVCYDQIGFNAFIDSGNVRLATYTDSSSLPDALEVETGSELITTTGFNDFSVTEWTVTTAVQWIADQGLNSPEINYNSDNEGYRFKAHTYGAYPDPLTATSDGGTAMHNLRISHS